MSSDALHAAPFDDHPHIVPHDGDQMIFDMDDTLNPAAAPLHWDPYTVHDIDSKSAFSFDTIQPMSAYEYGPPEVSPTGSYYDNTGMYNPDPVKESPRLDNVFSSWINESELSAPSPSSPISIPSPLDPQLSSASSFSAFSDQSAFPHDNVFSPSALAALHPLPSSVSPPSSYEDHHPLRQRLNSLSKPTWASNLWDHGAPNSLRTPSVMRPSVRHSPLSDGTIRQRVPVRRDSHPSAQPFLSTSAPSLVEARAPSMSRTISRRSESVSISDDRDATVRRKKRSPGAEEIAASFVEKPSADARK